MSRFREDRRQAEDMQLVARLRDALLDTLRDVLDGAQTVDFVDYPDHYNAGDAALWLGQRAALRDLGVHAASVSTRSTYDAGRLRGDGPIVLLGGGNLGGLYPTHHALKLSILADWPHRRVIQLPQSLHYAGEQERNELRRAVARHGATTLILRDERSFSQAQRDFDCEVKLAPDLAFGLGPLQARLARTAFVVQMRTDKESAGAPAMAGMETFDWLEARPYEKVTAYNFLYQLSSRVSNVSDSRITRASFLAICDRFGKANLTRGVSMLSMGERLGTDRLHGHILACLLGIDHVVVNDQFGKIEAMWKTWTGKFACARYFPTWPEAWEGVGDLRWLAGSE